MNRVVRSAAALAALASAVVATPIGSVRADDGYARISGEGSSWAYNAIASMQVNVQQFGMTVDYSDTGSTAGRQAFIAGTADFAASDIPFQFTPEDGSSPEVPNRGYAYIPVVAGGTAFMYNLKINGQQVTNLRLSGENVAKIFTGVLTMWNDPAIQADNPGLVLPARAIVPVVRSDGSGSTAQFTTWMINRYPAIWNDYCQRSGRAPACGFTSFYPTIPGSGMIAQSGDSQVAGYVTQSYAEGAIGYANYSYALQAGFPVAKVLNAAGYYTEPTPENVAVSLLKAQITDDPSNPAVHLTQNLDGVYSDTDPRNYQLSSYSYFILPTEVKGDFNEAKGRSVARFAYYAMCEAQHDSASLGYSPMPINLVQASFDQIRKIPGAEVQNIDVQSCNNPTFSTDGTNTLAQNAPQPPACDAQGIPTQCSTGTAGNHDQTPVSGAGDAYTPGGNGGNGGGNGGSGGGNGGSGGGDTGSTGGGGGGDTGGDGSGGGGGDTGGSGGGDTGNGGDTGGDAGGGGETGNGGGDTGNGGDTGGSGGDTGSGGGGDTGGGDTGSGGNTGGNGQPSTTASSTTAPCATTSTSTSSTSASSSSTSSSSTTSTSVASASGAATSTSSSTTTTVDPCAAPVASSTTLPASGGTVTEEVCDADTGVCGTQVRSVGQGAVASLAAEGVPDVDRQVSPVQPSVVGDGSSWGLAQTLMVVVVLLLTAAIIVVPSFVWRRLGRGPGAGSAA